MMLDRICAWALTGLVVVALPSCSLSQSQVSGVVREAGTGRPVSGAAVAVKWTYYLWHTHCLHLQTAMTDANGRFHIPIQTEVLSSGRPNIEVATVVAYKEGYRSIFSAGFLDTLGPDYVLYKGSPDGKVTSATLESLGLTSGQGVGRDDEELMRSPLPSWWQGHSKHDKFMVPDISTAAARIEYLTRHFSWTSCYRNEAVSYDIVPFYERIYAEVRKLAVSPQLRSDANKLCRWIAETAVTQKLDGDMSITQRDKMADAYLRDRHPECLRP